MKTQSSLRLASLAPAPSRFVLRLASLAILVLTLLPASAHAQGGMPLWTNRYDGPGNLDDYARGGIALDRSGNVFVTGSSSDTNGSAYAATIKYSGAGVPLWTNRYGPGGATAIAVDNNGNVFVTGYDDSASATIKYSGAGMPLWTNRYVGPGNNGARAIAVDNNGRVFVTANSRESTNSFNSDIATIAYSNSGVPIWTNLYAGPENPSNDGASAIAVDSNGNVFVTGGSAASVFDSGDFVTIKYSSDGVLLWINLGGFSDGSAKAIAVDSSSNVFVTGEAWNGSSYDYTTIKYSPEGEMLWTRQYDGPGNEEDDCRAIAVDSSGNVFVTGYSYTGFASEQDYVTIKYSPEGESLWTRRYNGPGNNSDAAFGIALDSNGNVFVTGKSIGNGSDFDYTTIAYSNSGIPLWTNRYNGPGNNYDEAFGNPPIAVDSSGNVFVTGTSGGIASSLDYAMIKYSSSILPPRLDFQLLNNQLVLSWTNAGFNLQSAPAVTGTFTNLPGATSPYTNPISGGRQFFRLKGD